MATVVARISGIVTYADGSKGEFATHLDHLGRLSYNGVPVSRLDDTNTGISDSHTNVVKVHNHDALLDTTKWLSGTGSLISKLSHLTYTAADGRADDVITEADVTGLNAEFSGRITLDDSELVRGHPSWEDFLIAFWMKKQNDGSIVGAFRDTKATVTADGAGTDPWDRLYANTPLKNALATLLNPLNIRFT